MNTPTTDAGKALARNFQGATSVATEVRRLVLAIEAQSAAAERARIVGLVEAMRREPATNGYEAGAQNALCTVLAAIEGASK